MASTSAFNDSMHPIGPTRFHHHHGSNILLDSERVTATRSTSFANALTFSEQPLAPGEIFLIEIEENETGWSGNMRIGLTQMNPNVEFPLPLYALPDLVSMGPSWLYAITKTHNNLYTSQRREVPLPIRPPDEIPPEGDVDPLAPVPVPPVNEDGQPQLENGALYANDRANELIIQETLFSYRRHPKVISVEGTLVRTPRGYVQLKSLLPSFIKARDYDGLNLLATDIGSRIGVMYVPTSENKADMHFIINGQDQGPCARDIPYKAGAIFAVVDVYGSTKRVRVVQLHEVESLQSLCRDVILRSIRLSGVSTLPLPKLLKDYLMYNF